MIHPRHMIRRWSLRRTVLGIALVLHVGWMSLGVAPAAAAAVQSPMAAHGMSMPCHDAMMQNMAAGESVGEPGDATPPGNEPAHLPCCAQHCACASGMCAIGVPRMQGARSLVRYLGPVTVFPMLASRAPTPELRPPILH